MSKFNMTVAEYREIINTTLFKAVDDITVDGAVKNAMRYSLEAGGKRLRPMLLLEFFRVFNKGIIDINIAIPSALAIEMIHTFSLIHDDLPCMDNDDMRRGKPSCHRAFPEWSALLAGDALSLFAIELVSSGEKIDSIKSLAVVNELCRASGISGMIGGQQFDMVFETRIPNEKELITMYRLKTAALLKAACRSGCIIAGAKKSDIENAGNFAEKLGLAFQLKDDILDIEGDFENLGKPIGSDSKQGKTTYVSLFGLEKAKEEAEKLTNEALSCLKGVPENDFLVKLTEELLKRKN